jgi:hypothetical protein
MLSLPNEVLVGIFSFLHPRDIAACQRSCQQLNEIVIHSQLLQYLIRIGRSGLHDPLLPGYTISQRIEALDKWETTWRNLEFKSSYQIKHAPSRQLVWNPESACRIQDDFLIAINCFDRPGYAYVDLRTFQPGVEEDFWTTITADSWRGKHGRFVFSPEKDFVLAAL